MKNKFKEETSTQNLYLKYFVTKLNIVCKEDGKLNSNKSGFYSNSKCCGNAPTYLKRLWVSLMSPVPHALKLVF